MGGADQAAEADALGRCGGSVGGLLSFELEAHGEPALVGFDVAGGGALLEAGGEQGEAVGGEHLGHLAFVHHLARVTAAAAPRTLIPRWVPHAARPVDRQPPPSRTIPRAALQNAPPRHCRSRTDARRYAHAIAPRSRCSCAVCCTMDGRRGFNASLIDCRIQTKLAPRGGARCGVGPAVGEAKTAATTEGNRRTAARPMQRAALHPRVR